LTRRDELRAFIESLDVVLPEDFHDDSPLISSGIFDSLALFNLVLWIEGRVGAPVNPAALDVAVAWDSVRRIADFIEHVGDPTARRFSTLATPSRAEIAGVRIETYTPAHEDAAIRLQAGLWSPDVGLNHRYLRWKYEENPYGVQPRIYLAYDKDELIGMRGFYPSRWEIGETGQFENILVADDLIIGEDYRNRGIVTLLMQTALADLHRCGEQYVLNLSGGDLTVLGSLAMGWHSVGHLRPIGRSSPTHALLSRLRDHLTQLPYVWRYRSSTRLHTGSELNPFAHLDAQPRVHSTSSGIEVAHARASRATEMAQLVNRLGYDGRIRHVRDAAYLDWRYRNPLNDYRFLYIGGPALRGYLALKWTRSAFAPNPRVQIVDWEAEDETCLDALLEAAIGAGACPELTTWSANLGTARTELLARHGFAPVELARAAHGCPCVLIRACEPERPPDTWRLRGTPLLDQAHWDMRMIYSMSG
jgi:acyl carrier protein